MSKLYDEENDYITEDHIHSFAKALLWEDSADNDGFNSGALLPREYEDARDEARALRHDNLDGQAMLSPVRSRSTRPDRIASKNDWFPLSKPTKSKRKHMSTTERLTNEFRHLASFTLLRWPVLFIIVLWVLLLCLLYAIVRMYVALLEYFFTWTGERRKLRNKLRSSKTYEEWIENAQELDKFLGLDKWLNNPRFSYYDYRTIQKCITKLRTLREHGDIPSLVVILQGCLKKNFAGIENRQLYSHRYYGTKHLVQDYIDEVTRSIDFVTNSDDSSLSLRQKRHFFKVVSKNYGKSALVLSGGACFAYTHFGIVKALLDNNLLPLIVSGTSGGGVIAALCCTRSNQELRKLLVPELARKITACEDPWWVWIPRFWRTGARFDAVAWARKSSFFTKGSTTFQEAYKATGRKLNISTVPAEAHLPVILCNTVTSPNCLIWLSLLASLAVPGILNPVVLMMKDPKTQKVSPFSMGNKWRDGSLRTDIPVQALNTYYNVNFSIVSQVNPHISLFFFAPKGTVGRPVAISRHKTTRERYANFRGGLLLTAAEQILKLEIKKWLQVVKVLDLLPHWLDLDWLSIFLQRFTGSVTIWPRNKLKDFLYILLDPTEERMEEYLLKGQRSMFPRLLFVKHRLLIERAIERGRNATKIPIRQSEPMSRSPSVTSENVSENPTQIAEMLKKLWRRADSSDEEAQLNLGISPFQRVYLDSDDSSESEQEDSPDDEKSPHDDSKPTNGSLNLKHRRYTVF